MNGEKTMRIKEMTENLRSWLSDEKRRVGLIVLLGTAAVLMLLFSECSESCDKKETSVIEDAVSVSAQEYSDKLERDLETLLSGIEGAGRVNVMVTLQNGVEYVYASADKTSSNTSQSEATSGGESRESRENTESSYIIIKTEKGEEALVRTELMPSVKGVVIVCDGGNDPETSRRISQAAATALGISANKVCIVPMRNE